MIEIMRPARVNHPRRPHPLALAVSGAPAPPQAERSACPSYGQCDQPREKGTFTRLRSPRLRAMAAVRGERETWSIDGCEGSSLRKGSPRGKMSCAGAALPQMSPSIDSHPAHHFLVGKGWPEDGDD